MTWKGWTVLILSLWLIISAFIPGITGSSTGNLVNFLIVGIIMLVVSFPMFRGSRGIATTVLIFSVWLIISAFISGITGSKGGALTNYLIVGIVTLISSIFYRD
ncbi:hypothetical protein HNP65_001817 [Thermosipho japonicus]|uniref:SPW repeat-containing integral membrane domain-containing protein n=1 Tax=Thermosipho japonicus TaxID=90323 RepID=A0A841GLT1_9BACT|nr:SPW repeat protein [Thermosipho japonicus]MBB6063347.1 hypothetical protein [Thermosipho japonicus]